MSVRQYDSANAATLPAGEEAYAGYFTGLFRSYQGILARFPGARYVLPIATWLPTVGELAGFHFRQVAFDFEKGDLQPGQALAALDVAHHAGIPCPVCYGSLDTWLGAGGLVEVLAGERRGGSYQGWLAHPDAIPTVPRGFAAKQYLFGPDADISTVVNPDTFYNVPAPPTPEEIMAVAAATNKDGRIELFVERNDGSVWHTYQTEPDGSWHGAEPGVRNAALAELTAPPAKP